MAAYRADVRKFRNWPMDGSWRRKVRIVGKSFLKEKKGRHYNGE